jgi:hypothetical protein
MRFVLPRSAHLWLPGYISACRRRQRPPEGVTTHVLFCLADHYEPNHANASMEQERARVARWRTQYPSLFGEFRDADGRPPQHSFFFPAEVYREEHLDSLAELCAAGFGEVEVHLHHGNDTSAGVREQLERFTTTLAVRHGLLSRFPDGRIAYAFIHGNWALDNGRLDDSVCGVNDELTILRETGCYADLTMPAVPDPAQSRIVNSIYYVQDDPGAPRSYDTGVVAAVGRKPPSDSLLLIEGPLTVWWPRPVRRLMPRIDSGTLDRSAGNRPSALRFARWVDARVSVAGRPEWVFVKVHTHGAPEFNADVLLGDDMVEFHRRITKEFNDGSRYRLHYVTAREMYNIVKAAEAGMTGDPGEYRDYEIRLITAPAGRRTAGSVPA